MKYRFHLPLIGIFLYFLFGNAFAQQNVHLPNSNGRLNKLDTEIVIASTLYNGESVEKKIKDNIFVKVITNKPSCFVGEPLLVTYKLYTRLHSKSKVIEPPIFSSCSVVEMTTDNLKEVDETIQGKTYRTFIIRKVQLFPLQEGKLSLGITKVNNTITFSTLTNGQFNPILKEVILENNPLTIEVKPLPMIDSTKFFTGVVGLFFMQTKLLKPNDTVGNSNSLEISITGKGNFLLMQCPKVAWPTTIQSFEPQTAELVDKLSFPILGTKTFTIPFSCKQAGQQVIPSFQFTFFDADAKQFVNLTSDTIRFSVLPAPAVIKYETPIFTEEVSNMQYLWIVGAIALVIIIIILAINLFKKNRKEEIPTILANATFYNNPTIEINYKDQLEELSGISSDDELEFYTQAKQLAQDLLQNPSYSNEISKLEQIVFWSNQTLYASIYTDRDTVISIFNNMIG